MRKRITSLLIAVIMLLQVFIAPQNVLAEGDKNLPQGGYVKVGEINAKNYDAKIMNELSRIAARNRTTSSQGPGVSLFSEGPYFNNNNEPKDEDKPKYFGNVSANLDLIGLDGKPFQWNEIFGVDESGNPKPAQIIFRQIDDESSVDTGLYYMLQITKEGKYTWSDGEGKPTKLPLFSKSLKPFKYEVRIDERVSDKVELLTSVSFGTEGSSPTFSPENADGEIIANITLGLTYKQIASTKFKSEWHTGVDESDRPNIKANFSFDDEGDGVSPVSVELPKNDKDTKIIRDWYNEFDPDLVMSFYLEKTPDVTIDESTDGLTFDTTNKTVDDGKHKFRYDFTYDVIDGGKLTMTEIIPITFDANGGKFENFTAPNTAEKTIKEVEYGKDLTDKVEEPKKSLETFKGWATEKNGTPLTEEEFQAEMTNVTEAKTFYAIWENNDLVAEELVVHESYKEGDNWINKFIPNPKDLNLKIKIKNDNGDLEALKPSDNVEYLNDADQPIYSTDLENYLYEKLKEKDNPDGKPTRTETIKARVTRNGKEQIVDIPITVYKNIYEAKTLSEKPYYVPEGYVKVTLDPTTKAEDPQKTYYYVNPEAKVEIPGNDPTGKDDYLFVGWKTPQTPDNEVFKLDERHQFDEETVIKAQYTKDVIPQEGDKKPDTVPDDFVKVTFVPTDKGTMEGDKIFWVNPKKDVIIPVKDPVGKEYQTFDKWKMGKNADGNEFDPTEAHRFSEKETIITATYKEADDIIEYDPKEPKERPDGYVRVTFEADPGLQLTEQKAYYVKKNAGITLGNTELKKPAYKEEDGYKFDKWDPADTTEIKEDDIVVRAKAQGLDDVIPKTKDDESEKPKGYITVKFSTEKNGKIKGTDKTEKIVYVNPNKAVSLDGFDPEVEPNTGYDFADWDTQISKKIQYSDGDIIKAIYNEKGDVIPQENTDGSDRPDGYLTVTFDKGDSGELSGKTVYYVKPNKEVTVPAPTVKANVGYSFDKWDQELTQTFTTDTTITAEYNKHDDIIPSTNDDGTANEKPDGYVTLTFDKGEHGKLEGKRVYYVNPKADPAKTLAEITKPEVKADTGYIFTDWDTDDTTSIASDMTVTAKYDPIDDVIPKTTDDESEKPDGYITVTFEKGDHGNLEGNTVYYVNPNKAVVLKGKEPTVTPETGYDFASWDTSIERAIQYKDNDKITALYNKKGDLIPQEKTDGSDKPAGYLTVTFKDGEHGQVSGQTVYYVKPNAEVTVPAPTVTPNTGYKQKDGENAWDEKLTQKFIKDTDITAQYEELKDIIPQKNTDDSDKPKGYVKVIFKADDNGSLSGNTVYYVNPEKEVDLSQNAFDIVKNPNTGYTAKGGSWNPDITKKKYIDDVTTYTFNFKELGNVIPETNDDGTKNDKPDGYVKVEFIAGDNGSLVGGNKTYFVNPSKDITVGSTDLPIPVPQANDNYVFDKWYEEIDQTEPIKTDKKFVARFKLGKVTMTYTADDKTSGEVPAALSYDVGTEITLAGGNDLKKDNYSLTGWEIDGTIYAPGAKFKLEKNTTAKAVWKEGLHTVEFNTDGGTYIPTRKVEHGKTIGQITPPTKEGYLFVGWEVDGKPFNPETDKVTKDLTLVAKYSNDVIPQPGEDKPDNVPDNFVQVTFDPTDEGSLEGPNTFWVNPDKEVTIPVKTPSGKDGKSFKRWKIGDTVYDPTKPHKFEQATTITATYGKNIDTGRIEVDDKGIISTPIVVDKGATVDPKIYEKLLKPSDPERTITKIVVTENPDTSVGGVFTSALITVTLDDGSIVNTKVLVYVKEPCDNTCPNPGENPGGGEIIPGPSPTPDPDPDPTPGEEDPKPEEPGDDEKPGDKDPEKEPKDPDKDEQKDPDKEKDPENNDQTKPDDKTPSKEKPNDKTPSKKPEVKVTTPIKKVGKKIKGIFNPSTGVVSHIEVYLGLIGAAGAGLFFAKKKDE